MKQADVFLESEGQAWFERNKDKLPPEHDPVMEIIEKAGIIPNNVLEIGCGNGWRVDLLRKKYGSAYGIDPGIIYEIDRGIVNPTIPLWTWNGIASDLRPIKDKCFDLLIYGFCLYLIDREDLFKVVTEGDRVLQDGGYLIIQDFMPLFPHKVKYKHKDGIFTYKMDHAQLWLANPAYKMRGRIMCAEETSVTILKKDINNGWPIKE